MDDPQTQNSKQYTDLEVKELPGSEVELSGEIPTEVAHKHRMKAVRKIQKNLELPGFRKGHVPEEMVLEHVGEAAVMQEVAELALSVAYPQIVEDKKLDVVGRPEVSITKLAAGNPIGFKITSAVYPHITLPNYKKIAAEEVKKHDDPESVEVTESDVDAELLRLQKMLAGAPHTGGDAKEEDSKEGVKEDKTEETTLPELDDDFARQLGDFQDLAHLKDKIRTGLGTDKKQKAHEKRRIAIADSVIAKSTLEVPKVFVDGEIGQMMASFEDRVSRAGMKLDDYLEQVKKTADDLRKEWQPDALKRAKLQLIFNEIAKEEKLSPDTEKLEREVQHVKEHYPDAEESSIRNFVAAQMMNEAVFEFLEGGTQKRK